jgi:DNA-binding PadR family transcriptional regulator
MPADPRSNPLALAVLVSLSERPMHPYEVASTLRQREKHASVRLNYGSLYSVVASLERRGLIEPRETVRSGRLPERTIYAITEAGVSEMRDWLAHLVSTPVRDYTSFEAGLSFLPALRPDYALALLRERQDELNQQASESQGSRGLLGSDRIPRLFWIEEEYRAALRNAELAYLDQLIHDIDNGSLDGLQWWNSIHYQNNLRQSEPDPATAKRIPGAGKAITPRGRASRKSRSAT